MQMRALRAALAVPLFAVMLAVTLQAGRVYFRGAPGGTLGYSGGNAPLIGTDIPLSQIQAYDQYGNLILDELCTACLFQFTTGNFLSRNDGPVPPGVFVTNLSFAGGGSFSITGSIRGSPSSLLGQGREMSTRFWNPPACR